MYRLNYGSCCIKGKRHHMEDFFGAAQVFKSPVVDFFGVFDGHYGTQTASYLSNVFPSVNIN